ncbi:MAG: Endonuclease/Exonuclease/phosphatase family protein [Nocardioides sp.]|nr:Endonuclease/Exonuclease/phosphatase family protein [Nocardioides sp.]
MVVSLLLVADGDDPAADATGASTSISAAEVAATHTPQASRSERRGGQLAGADSLGGRRAVPLDNAAARRGVRVVHERRVQARIKARQARLKAKRLRRAARLAAREKTSTFRIGSLNVLGSQHSAGPGGYGPGTDRAAMAAGLVMSRGVDVLTMSEVQDDQLGVLNARLAGYSIWPQQSLGSNGQRLQIAWRASQFEMVDGGSVTFTFASQAIPMPYVLLRDLGTGAEFWVISIHTSAGGLEGERDAGTAIAISLMKRLEAESGKPVLIGGDVNEHEEFFYKVCGATGFLAANGGGAGCSLPPAPLRVDWIMGGGGAGVNFSGYVQDGATLARISDHYFIHAAVSVVDPGGTP